MILGIGSQRRGCIIAYGRYPEKGMLFPPNSPVPAQNKAFATALMQLTDQLAETVIAGRESASHVMAIGIDRGWKPRVVEWVCLRSKHKALLYPSLGFNWSKYAPERQDGKARSNVVAVADHCYLAQGKGFRYIGHHSDYWREYAQRSFLVPALTPGATAIYGTDPLAHYDLAIEIVAEYLAGKGVDDGGKEFWRWTSKPGSKNHGLDQVTGALALASYLRLYDATQVLAGGRNKNRKSKIAPRVRIVRRTK
jgi:hypothetical protein